MVLDGDEAGRKRDNNKLEIQNFIPYSASQFMERTRGEIILFAAAAFGIWVSIWAVILVSKWLEAASLAITLAALCGFALRDES
jgi:nitrate reductase NapE component